MRHSCFTAEFPPFQGVGEPMSFSIYFKDLDGLVGRTCCKSATVIVKDSIVLQR